MKKLLLTLLACVALNMQAADKHVVVSPSKKLKVELTGGKHLALTVSCGDEKLLEDVRIGVQVGEKKFGEMPVFGKAKMTSIHETYCPVVPIKNKEVANDANELRVNMKGGYAVVVRAYDNAVAYRFEIAQKGKVEVLNETFDLNLAEPCNAHVSFTDGFVTSYEHPYSHLNTADYKTTDKMTHLPVLLESPRGTKMLVSETDVRDYPHMFLKSSGNNGFVATFPKSPLEWKRVGDRSFEATKEADGIAITDGIRSLPWRFVVIGDDKAIAENQIEALLGGRCEMEDTSWIRPGKVIWDWWNHWAVWGVDFKVGINNDTYKYFIDFAADYGIEYILLDEGWCKNVEQPFDAVDDIDVRELVEYGEKKGVGVILWMTWRAVDDHMDVIEHYAKMGVKALKIDFMDHSNQWMVNFYERVIKECAKYKMMVDFHGSFKPAGLEQRYPNLISQEGVRGMENGGACVPENTIWMPFMRNAVGHMDFTPGSMESTQPEENRQSGTMAMGVGTRAQQMAMYVCFESGLQMLADSPTRYMKEEECARYIASVPVTWDESRVLAARAGQYYVVARRHGEKWFIGAMTGKDAQDIEISLDFLRGAGKLTSFEDGVNAHRFAVDYKKHQQNVTPQTNLKLHLARNGGWFGVVE